MQYLLTSDEYEKLQAKVKEAKKAPNTKDLQEVCTLLADTFILTEGWRKGHIWGCIITEAAKNDGGEWYCDECPAQKVCPYPHKEWSK